MDSLSASLAIRLQLEDIEELRASSKGKQAEGDVSDKDHAFTLYAAELEQAQLYLSDRRMGYSISQAVRSDADIIRAIRTEEDRTHQDRRLAYSLGGVKHSVEVERQEFSSNDLTDEDVQQLSLLNICQDLYDSSEEQTESSKACCSKTALPNTGGRLRTSICTACQESKPFFDVLKAPCDHHYCRTCIADLFQASISDESLFPPRCCRTPIPVTSAEDFLAPDLIALYYVKSTEFSTPNRTYCHRATCSAFISPTAIKGDIATCFACWNQTCAICKQECHTDDCPNDPAIQSLLDLAREEEWMRCYMCRRMVELSTGCNHITCHCSAQFCYVCGEQWKTCACPQWNEGRLLARANQVLQRDARPGAPVVAQQQVERVVQHLRNRHGCDHDNWKFVRGANDCEECGQHLPQYIFECKQCRLWACNRCRRNRL